MVRKRVMALCLLVIAAMLAACAAQEPRGEPATSSTLPTTGPQQASTAPAAVNSTVAPAATEAGAPQPTVASEAPATAAAQAVQPSSTPSKGKITVAFDTFPTYFPAIIMQTQGLLKRRGYDLELVPFLLDGQNNYSEDERYEKLRTGEWDVLATTLDSFARRADPQLGAVTTVIDESAGVDKLISKPEINIVNDLKGKRVAVSQGSVGEYFLYYTLNVAGMTPQDVTLVPRETVDDAVQAYLNGEADAVSAWEPNVSAAEQSGKTLITSDKLRTILDVLVTSRSALTNKPDAVQAFHDAWYEALRMMIDSPDQAGKAIVDWGHSDWTLVARPEDLKTQLGPLAQATLGSNQIAFQSPDILVRRLQEAQQIWGRAGVQVTPIDFSQVVNGQFALGSANTNELFSTQPPVNSTFLLTARVQVPSLASSGSEQPQSVLELPLKQIEFESDATRLTPKAIEDLTNQVLPVLRASSLYLQIQGSSAWPGPAGRYKEEDIAQFAHERAVTVASFLTQQGIDPNRLVISTIPSKFPETVDQDQLAQDRIVVFTLAGGGR